MLYCEDQNQILGFYNKQGGNTSNIYLCRATSSGKTLPFMCGFGLFTWFSKRTTRKQADEVRKVVMNELLSVLLEGRK